MQSTIIATQITRVWKQPNYLIIGNVGITDHKDDKEHLRSGFFRK